ncbi:hypothetical protein NQP46_24650 [Streptomyces albus]|nr:hypothetical protein NQP46_24650 [Streptomyces albus]
MLIASEGFQPPLPGIQSIFGFGRAGAGTGLGPLFGFWSIGGFGGATARTVVDPVQPLVGAQPG